MTFLEIQTDPYPKRRCPMGQHF